MKNEKSYMINFPDYLNHRLMIDAAESSINSIGIADTQGNLIYVNNSFVIMWGYQNKHELLGRSLLEFWDGDGIFNTLKELKDKGKSKGEDIAKRKDGSLFPVFYTASIIKDEESSSSFLFGSFVDITIQKNAEDELQKSNDALEKRVIDRTTELVEANKRLKQEISLRKKVEEDLRKSEGRLKFAVDNTDQGLWEWDIVSGAITVNENWYHIIGYRPGEIVIDFEWWGKNIHPESLIVFDKVLKDHLEGRQKYYELEYQIKNKSNEWQWIWERGVCVAYGAQNEPLKIIGTVRDITEKKQTENALKKSEKKYRQLFSAISDAIMVFDSKTRDFVDVNEAVTSMYGYSKDEFLKLNHRDITAEPEESDQSIYQTIQGKVLSIPLRYHKRKDGSTFPVEITSGTFEIADQQVIFGVIKDISKRKNAENELKKLNETLESKVKERTFELEELNTALKVLLKKREQDKAHINENIYSTYDSLIDPLIHQLDLTLKNKHQIELLNIIKKTIEEVISPFSKKMSDPMIRLTPSEILVAGLVKEGKTTKEISTILNKSIRVVRLHRGNIRAKLGLKNEKINLRSYLFSLR